MISRINNSPLRLSLEIILAAAVVLIAAAAIGAILEIRQEFGHLEAQTREQASRTLSVVANLIAQPVADNEIATVRGVMRDVVNGSPQLEYAGLFGPNGEKITSFPEYPYNPGPAISSFRSDLVHVGHNYGELVIYWAAGPDRIGSALRAKETLVSITGLILAIGLAAFLAAYQLGSRPLARINSNIAAILRRAPVEGHKLPRFAAKQLVALSESVGAFEKALKECDQREEDLRIAHAAMESASKSKSEFLDNMSHEVRTSMNGILGMAELLLETKLSADQRAYAETIAKSGSELMPVISDVLDFSKMEAGKLTLHPEPFDLHRTIENLVTKLSTQAFRKDIEINFRYDPDLPTGFVADAGRIRQVLTNIVGNAVKFTRDGHVLIDVSGCLVGNKTQLKIEVSDTGIGIPEDRIVHIFKEFEQSGTFVGKQFGVVGLGLSISSHLVGMMGGTIAVHSEMDKGSIFTIHLQLEQSKEIPRLNPVDSRVLRNRAVLIVDDLQINRTILSERLRNWGVNHKAVSSGAQALSLLEETAHSGIDFDAIIVDYHMPGMNGCELAAKIRSIKNCGTVPIILLSSVDVTCEPLSEDASIFEVYLLKPVRSETLKAVLANAITRKGTAVTPKPDETKLVPTNSALNGATILIAEDNKTNQLVLRTMLKTFHVDVITVENGQNALENFVSRQPDLILMDMAMPIMDGLDATRKIREFEAQTGRQRTPIVALTANAMSGDRENCLNAGMDDYLSKPVIKSNLVATMEKWIFKNPDPDAGNDSPGMADGAQSNVLKAP